MVVAFVVGGLSESEVDDPKWPAARMATDQEIRHVQPSGGIAGKRAQEIDQQHRPAFGIGIHLDEVDSGEPAILSEQVPPPIVSAMGEGAVHHLTSRRSSSVCRWPVARTM